MIAKEIHINQINGKIQYLSEVYPIIETNTILNKTITGVGATYSEIKAPRHSIIIEPSKTVIYGKTHDPKHKEDNLFGVVEKVYPNNIIDYINNSLRQGKRIKILTTPESFGKVQNAFYSLDIDIQHNGYFLLFDEVHKTVKDSNYRENITLPMDYFFDCDDKAIVSATPPQRIIDKRLKHFQQIKIVPDFDYKNDLALFATNNILQRTRELLETLKSDDRHFFFFINSVSLISSMMKQLNIYNQSAVFCSSESKNKLMCKGFNSAYDNWDKGKIAKYNWMTSRFYCALDIDIPESPIIIMLTDCYKADYTMIDPYMDAVQIVGRFRNGVGDIYHITNFDRRYGIKRREELKEDVRIMKHVYRLLDALVKSASTEAQRKTFREAQSILPYHQFLKEGGKLNTYAIDNYFYDETIRSLYNDSNRLLDAYKGSGFFNVTFENTLYAYGDYEQLKIQKCSFTKEKRKEIVAQLDKIGTLFTITDHELKRELELVDPFIVRAYYSLGKEEIERLNYSQTKIEMAMIVKKHQKDAQSTDAIEMVNACFHPRQWYSSKFIKTNLIEIFNSLNIPTKGVTAKTITDYFEAKEKRTNKFRGYYLEKSYFGG